MTEATTRDSRWAPALAWGVWGLALALTGVGLWLLAITQDAPRPDPVVFGWGTIVERVLATGTGAIGAVVAARRPRLPIGWLLLVITLGFPLWDVAEAYARHAMWTDSASWGWRYAAWSTNWTWALAPGLLPALLLVFPTGRPLSPRWGVVLRVAWVELVLLVLVTALAPGPLDAFPRVSNPLSVPGLPDLATDGLGPVLGIAFLGLEALTLVALVGLLLRYRRSTGDERLQMKWVAWGATVLVSAILAGPYLTEDLRTITEAMGDLALTGALAAALLRYRLYDIDRLVSRTVTYALVTGILLAVYTASVLAMRPVVEPLTGGSDLAVAGSTLVVAAAFGPLRRRVQALVDHRFNRRQYDAGRAVEAFGQRLRDEVDLDDVTTDLQATVTATLQPANTSVVLLRSEWR